MLSNLHASFLSEFSWDVFSAFFFALITLKFCFLMLKLGPHSVHVINFKFLTIQIWCAIAYHWLSASDFRGGVLMSTIAIPIIDFKRILLLSEKCYL